MRNKRTQSFHDARPVFCFSLVQENSITRNHRFIFIFKMIFTKIFNHFKIIIFKLEKAFFEPWVRGTKVNKFLIIHKFIIPHSVI